MWLHSKSKLRQKDPPALGPKYSGVRVSRAALDDSSDAAPGQDSEEEEDDSEEDEEDSEQFDDPDTADLERDNIIDDEEIDSDDAFGEGEEEMFKKKGFTFKDSKAATNGRPRRAVAADFMSGSEEEEEGTGLDEDSDSDGAGAQLDESEEEEATDDGDNSEDGSDSEDESEDEHMSGLDNDDGQSDLRKRFAQAQKAVVPTISQAAKEEAQKGVAARQQRRTYDSLLNLRIRLQKGLVAINSLGEATGNDDDLDGKEAYEAAEEAAIKLWTTIDGFRASLLPDQRAGQKRKRDIFDIDTPTETLWEHMQSTEENAATKRREVLEKWANKVKHTVATISKERQLGGAAQSVVAALEGQLVSSAERLVKRTQVPRSCAPAQAARKVAQDPSIYDDADFYQLLLKELVDQRSSDAGAGANGANGDVPTVRWTAVSEAKNRKQVDRRASKGRKLRFAVHEKLQNFMAPEDRRNWEEEAIDRLFGTLFGQRMGLKEDAEDGDEVDEVVAQEEGLRLFRS